MPEQDNEQDNEQETLSIDPKCNQSTGVTTFGHPSASAIAAAQQAKFAAYRAEQREYERIAAEAEAQRARERAAKAAATREATRLSFWDI